ncbi:MAG TPA: HAMP domain-containing sensor histidine kinase [Chthoniobacteraceae bacterium]|nr:HAMP domain-containing sensor histidine kinase [Chthoniobacteraceae bacterium]
MPLREICTVAHLAEIAAQCQEEIIGEWREYAGKLLHARNLDKLAITNHLPDLVAQITVDLEGFREGTDPVEHIDRSSPTHGVQRFHDGLDVGEVVAEYNLLRVAFITIAERHNLYVVGDAARLINLRIDSAVRMAVTSFAAQQVHARKVQEDEHLAFVVHDLRTPLNAASLLVEELHAGLNPQALADAGDLFEVLGRNLQRVGTLILRVVENTSPSSIAGNAAHPVRRTFELWPLVRRLLLELRPISTKNAIEIGNEIPPMLTVCADASLVTQVFQNLLGNAFRYTVGGRVVISARTENGLTTCVVRDNGTGIPPHMLAHVFDKRSTDPGQAGAGLGLAIVKQIVEAHGGQVRVESTPGDGARFSFTLPSGAE